MTETLPQRALTSGEAFELTEAVKVLISNKPEFDINRKQKAKARLTSFVNEWYAAKGISPTQFAINWQEGNEIWIDVGHLLKVREADVA